MRTPNTFQPIFSRIETATQQQVTERHGAAVAAQTYLTHVNPRAPHLAVPAVFDPADLKLVAPTRLWLVHQVDLPRGTRVDLLSILREAIDATGVRVHAGVVRDR